MSQLWDCTLQCSWRTSGDQHVAVRWDHCQPDPAGAGLMTACTPGLGKLGAGGAHLEQPGSCVQDFLSFQCPFFACFRSDFPPVSFKGHPWAGAS